jgi:hypothetical protein
MFTLYNVSEFWYIYFFEMTKFIKQLYNKKYKNNKKQKENRERNTKGYTGAPQTARLYTTRKYSP